MIEKLAQALWNAEKPYWNRNNPFGESVPWLWAEADEDARDMYRQLAVKVAAELGLIEETRDVALRPPGPPYWPWSTKTERRWVSAWSEVEQ